MKSKDKEDETNGRAWLSTVPEVVEMCAFELKLCPRQLFFIRANTNAKRCWGLRAKRRNRNHEPNIFVFDFMFFYSQKFNYFGLVMLCFY